MQESFPRNNVSSSHESRWRGTHEIRLFFGSCVIDVFFLPSG